MNHSQPDLSKPEKSEASFNAPIDLETLAIQQGVTPVSNPALLLGDFWPEEENADDFLQTLRAWRHEGGKTEVALMAVVVDTDVVSFLFKQDTRAQLYLPDLKNQLLIVSFMTIAELDRWALQHNWGTTRRERLEEHLRGFVFHPVNRALCRKWAEVSDTARRNGRPIQTADAWIAATALLHGIPLITHNSADYAGVAGLAVISHEA